MKAPASCSATLLQASPDNVGLWGIGALPYNQGGEMSKGASVQPVNPKVFVSHASEDKERFVLDFATRLRSKGIDAWVDRWEMLPGDSLVTKIFEEGIKNAQAMIVVISEHSIGKKWVRAELNAGVVNQIEQSSRLIPVIIGNVNESEIPQSLRDTLWERITDLANYDVEFERIVRSIYGQRQKPDLGEPPAYTRLTLDAIPGLTDVDSFIFSLCCEELIRTGDTVMDRVLPQPILEKAQEQDIHEQDVLEILEILENRGYVEVRKVLGGSIYSLKVPEYAFDEYVRTVLPDYDAIYRAVALKIVNDGSRSKQEIAQSLDQPTVIIDHILREMWNSKRIRAMGADGGHLFIREATPELTRWLWES